VSADSRGLLPSIPLIAHRLVGSRFDRAYPLFTFRHLPSLSKKNDGDENQYQAPEYLYDSTRIFRNPRKNISDLRRCIYRSVCSILYGIEPCGSEAESYAEAARTEADCEARSGSLLHL